MFNWLRRLVSRRRHGGEDANRLAKQGGEGERAADPGPIEELVRIVGESEANNPRARARQDFLWRRSRDAPRSRKNAETRAV